MEKVYQDLEIKNQELEIKMDKWNDAVFTCQITNKETFDTNYSEMQQCVCRYFEDGYFGDKPGPWDEHCS